jgi:light-harvesting complex I chlorophyll a/b binding protein 5
MWLCLSVVVIDAGGKFFDPIGFSRGNEAMYKKYKQNEITNGRLAMVANLGFWAQYAATGKGPIENLQVCHGAVLGV